jgi:hypothetical protein
MASTPKAPPKGPSRARGPRALDDLAKRLTDPALRRAGFAQSDIIARWPHIVGPVFAAQCLPRALRFPPGLKRGGTLEVLVEGPLALQLQHAAPLILERLNSYFGWSAVERLKLVHGAVPALRAKPKMPSPERSVPLPAEVAEMRDGPLKEALARLAATGLYRAVEPGDNPA